MEPATTELVNAYWRYFILESADPAPYPLTPAVEAVLDVTGVHPEAEPPSWADNWWAWQEVDRSVREGGPDAVNLLEELAAGAPEGGALGYLGAGPLENLVRWHGLSLARQLDEALEREPKLREALSSVRVGVEYLNPSTRFAEFYSLD